MPRLGRSVPGKSPGVHRSGGWAGHVVGLCGRGEEKMSYPIRVLNPRPFNQQRVYIRTTLFWPPFEIRNT